MNKPHKWAEVLRAVADGRDVQMRGVGTDKWTSPGGSLYFIDHSNIEWRVKPEDVKLKYRVALCHYECMDYTACVHTLDGAAHAEEWATFIRWLTDWIEVEV